MLFWLVGTTHCCGAGLRETGDGAVPSISGLAVITIGDWVEATAHGPAPWYVLG